MVQRDFDCGVRVKRGLRNSERQVEAKSSPGRWEGAHPLTPHSQLPSGQLYQHPVHETFHVFSSVSGSKACPFEPNSVLPLL